MACKRSAVRSRLAPPNLYQQDLNQYYLPFGAIAQLGERLHGMQEVSGSIPLSSTKYESSLRRGFFLSSLFDFFKPEVNAYPWQRPFSWAYLREYSPHRTGLFPAKKRRHRSICNWSEKNSAGKFRLKNKRFWLGEYGLDDQWRLTIYSLKSYS